MAQPWLKYAAPSAPGTTAPITLGHPDPYKARDQELQEEANRRAAEANARAAESNTRSTVEWNATHNPDGTPKQATKLEKLPVGMSSAIQENIKSLQQVEEALGALKSRPQSIGPGTGMLGDTFTQWNDPKGVDTRARLGTIGATRIHELSGAAVSASEAPRFQPFVPTVSDLPDTAQKKLEAFRDQLRGQLKEQLDYTRDPANGYLPYSTPEADRVLKGLSGEAEAPQDERKAATVGAAPTQTEGHFGDERAPPPTPPHADEFRNGLYNAMRSGSIKTPSDMKSWVQQFNQQNGTGFNPVFTGPETRRAIKAAREGRAFNVELPKYSPDISDMRGQGGFGEKADAAVRGAADTASFGVADKAAAVGDTIFSGGTYNENLARQYAISDYDTQEHFPSRLAGQVAGGFLVPMGEVSSLPQLAGKGAAIGAGYGVGSSRSLAEVPRNALLGGVAGAAVPSALVGAGRGIRAVGGAMRSAPAEVPSLVDPATGELNQVLDAMQPAQRVQAMRDYGMETITPGMAGGRSARVLEQGLNNLPGSAGVMEDVNSQASAELRRAAAAEAQKFGSSRTLNEGGGELQRGADEWMSRANRIARRVYDRISIPPKTPAALEQTNATLQRLTSLVESNAELAEEVNDPILAKYLTAMQKGLDWQGLKEFRTFIGAKAGEFRFSQDARKDGYQSLYGALSEDMRDTARSLGPKQLREFERANSFYAAKEKRVESALVRILGNNAQAAPEKAAAAVQAMTKGGKSTGDLRTLGQIRASTIKSGAWDEIAATLIHLGGQPANSEGRAFSPQTFVQWYADMAEPARQMLFKPELRKSLDGFVAMTQQLGRLKGLTNSSNTTPTMIGSGVIGASGMLAATNPLALAIPVAGGVANYTMAKLWTNPKAVNILTGYGRAAAAGNQQAVKSQIGRLTKLATTNPELRSPIQKLLASIANDNAPVVGTVAASPDQRPQDQAQPQ